MTVLLRLAGLLARLGPVRLAVVISLLPPDAMLAVRVGAEVALLRADHQLDELLAADYPGGRWHRPHPLPELAELQRRRYPPNGDRDEWIRHGPDGPPTSLPDHQKAA